ncbi:hypothetical protein Plhal304r1_c012g0048441 [Plasmopara halstedii]
MQVGASLVTISSLTPFGLRKMRSVKASGDQCEAYARPQCCISDGIIAWFLEFRFSVQSGPGKAAESAMGSD